MSTIDEIKALSAALLSQLKVELAATAATMSGDATKSAEATEAAVRAVLEARPWAAFAEESVAFCQELSSSLLHDPRAKAFPELLALGFWLRPRHLEQIAASYSDASGKRVRLGRGLAFHFAPNNVETLFAYSMLLSLLAGNSNVVRLGQRTSLAQELLLSIMRELCARPEFVSCAQRLLVVRYGHEDELSAFFSGHCAVRVIWGGDATVQHLRSLPLPAGSTELSFANKFSWAIADAGQVIAEAAKDSSYLKSIAQSFVTDAFSFGQQGCSSPRLLLWLGSVEATAQAQALFWPAVDEVLKARPFALSPAQVSERFLAASSCAAGTVGLAAGVERGGMRLRAAGDGVSYLRLALPSWEFLQRELHQGNGLFFELRVESLEEVLAHSRHVEQSISSLGISAARWHQAMAAVVPLGLCRVVAWGRALEFSPLWDGYDLIASLKV